MTQRPSEPILNWLRQTLQDKQMNVASLAQLTGEKRSTVRHVLGGQEPLTVDQLIGWTRALELKLEDFATMPLIEERVDPAPSLTARPRLRSLAAAETPDDPEDDPFTIDPYGNQAEQAIRLGFALGTNFTFVVDTTQIGDDSGVPAAIRGRFPERMPIQLDAAFHRFNEPIYDEHSLSITLSFGGTKTLAQFPWSSFLQVIYMVEAPPAPEPKAPEPPTGGRPQLRLVKE